MNLEEDQAEDKVKKIHKLMTIGNLAINALVSTKEKNNLMSAGESELQTAFGDLSTCSFIGQALVQALNDSGQNLEISSVTQNDLQKLYNFFSKYALDIAAELSEE